MEKKVVLIDYLNGMLAEFKADREEQLEDKWAGNYNMWRRVDNSGATDYDEDEEKWRSRAYIGVGRQKILSAYSLIFDLMMQFGRFPFSLAQTPIQEKFQNQNHKNMERVIRGQLTDCRAEDAFGDNILSGAIYGESFAKFGVMTRETTKYQADEATGEVLRFKVDEVLPNWESVSVWDIYRDLSTNDLRKGRGVIHRKLLTRYELRKLEEELFYDGEEIDKAISLGPTKTSDAGTLAPGYETLLARKDIFVAWEFWCRVPLYIWNEKDGGEDDGREIEVTVTICNGRIIRRSPLAEGMNRPLFRVAWERTIDEPSGRGVADNVEDMQDLMNEISRLYIDNKKLAGNVIMATKERLFESRNLRIAPGETIKLKEECQDVRQALQQLIVADVGETLLSAINFVITMTDEDSMIPKIAQGFSMKGTQTAFETSQLVEKAGKYIAGVIRNYDLDLIIPMVQEFYEWNMENGGEDLVGDYECRATAYDSYQSKTIRAASLQQLLAAAVSYPDLFAEFNLPEIARDMAFVMDFDADKYVKTEQEKAAEQPQGPTLEEEKMQAEIATELAKADKLRAETDAIDDSLDIEIEEKKLEILKDGTAERGRS